MKEKRIYINDNNYKISEEDSNKIIEIIEDTKNSVGNLVKIEDII